MTISGTRQAGYSLVEVLVSVAIVTTGLLGLASLQAAGLRWTADAAQHAAAVRLAQELAERIRAQPGEIDRYLTTATGAAVTSAACYGISGCAIDARVATDLAEWRAQTAATLPGGHATVCRDASPSDGSIASPDCTGGPLDPIVLKFWWTARDARGRSVEASALAAPVLVLPLRP